MTVVIHHNSKCGTSRKTLEMIRACGVEPIVLDYLEDGWSKSQLIGLFAAASITPLEAMRKKRSPAEELGLLEPGISDDAILDAMVEHPMLVERPIVCSPKGVRLCRPAETVQELLD